MANDITRAHCSCFLPLDTSVSDATVGHCHLLYICMHLSSYSTGWNYLLRNGSDGLQEAALVCVHSSLREWWSALPRRLSEDALVSDLSPILVHSCTVLSFDLTYPACTPFIFKVDYCAANLLSWATL